MTRRLLTPLLAATLVLAAGSHGALAQVSTASERSAGRVRALLDALEQGNVEAARQLMTEHQQTAGDVIAGLEDPRGTAAKTAYDVRRQALDQVMDRLAKAVHDDPTLRGRLLSLEVGGTAGAQERAQRLGGDAPGFTEKYADLDFQFRTTDPESSRAIARLAADIVADVPKAFGIHAFPAARAPQLATNTTDLNRIRDDQFRAADRRLADPEAAAGDAMHATELDTYSRGVAYEIDPATGRRTRTSIDLDAFYDKHSLQAPSYAPEDAFSVTVNERGKFKGLDDPLSAKRVTRAADALSMADYGAITAADREVIDLAGEINKTRSPAAAIEGLPKEHPLRADYDRRVAKGAHPADAAAIVLEPVTVRAQALLDKAVERSLDAKLAAIDRVAGMTDSALVDDLRARAKQGDATAERFMKQYERTRRGDRVDLVKAAREAMLESQKIPLAETFGKMTGEARARIAADPRWSGNPHVQNLTALAEVWSNPELRKLSGAVSDDLRGKGQADGDGPGGAVVPESAFGKALNQFDKAMFWMAMTGTLADVWQKRNEALAAEGPDAARAVFAEQVARQAAGLEASLMATVAVERLGLVLAEAGFPIVRSLISGAGSGMTVLAIADVTKALGKMAWQYAQEPLLRGYTNPKGPISFYQVLNARPETLRADMLAYARAHKLPMGGQDTRLILSAMVKDYFGRSGAPGGYTEGMQDRLVGLLVAQEDRSYQYLDRISDAVTADLTAGKPVPGAGDRRAAITRPAAVDAQTALAGEKDGPSDAEEAARKARERRKARIRDRADEAATAAEKEKAAADKASRDRAARDEQWSQLQQEGREESEVRRARAEEARVRQDAEARLRRDAEAQRKVEALRIREAEAARTREAEADRLRQQDAAAAEAQRLAAEAAMFEAVQIDVGVPSALPAGGQGTVSVQVRAPQGLRLAGRRVAIRASPGHTDDGSVPLGASGRGQTVYSAPAGYNGYVRVTASLDGFGQVSRTFLVGEAVAEAPPEQKIENPKQVTLPETPDPVTIIEVAFTTDEGRGSGRFEVRGPTATGRIDYEGTTVMEGEFEESVT